MQIVPSPPRFIKNKIQSASGMEAREQTHWKEICEVKSDEFVPLCVA